MVAMQSSALEMIGSVMRIDLGMKLAVAVIAGGAVGLERR